MGELRRPRLRPVGDRACIVDLPHLGAVLAVAEGLRSAVLPGVIDVVPAARTVLVIARDRAAVRLVERRIGDLIDLAPRAAPAAPVSAGRRIVIDAVYNGADLDAVAELAGTSIEGVISAHTRSVWRAAFGGFAPGFVYLTGGDPRLRVPRLASPRTAVPAGSVAIADEFSAVYPRESPGGWRLLGITSDAVWDPEREKPALLHPGDTVIFRPVRERVRGAEGVRVAGNQVGALEHAITVERTGLLALLEDGGRPGQAALGVPESGALDRGALASANAAVGNAPDAAGIEAIGGLALRAERDLDVAVAGAEAELRVEPAGAHEGRRLVTHGSSFRLRAGERLLIGTQTRGLRTYVAVRGGLAAKRVLGSVAHDSLSGLGSPPLRVGDRLAVGEDAVGEDADGEDTVGENAGGVLADPSRTALGGLRTGRPAVLRYVPGPRDDWFAAQALEGGAWAVTPQSNRVGIRLSGAPIARRRVGEIPTEGMVAGAIQVPPDGRPVLFLADHPTTGGYPVVGVLVAADLDRAAQLAPGAEVRFAAVDPDDIGPPIDSGPPIDTGSPIGTVADEGAAMPPAPDTVECSIEVDGRRVAVRVPGALAVVLDRARSAGLGAAVDEFWAELVRSPASQPAHPDDESAVG